MSSTQGLQGASSNALAAAADARRAAATRAQAYNRENTVGGAQETTETSRAANERNEDVAEKSLKQAQAERDAELQSPRAEGGVHPGRAIDFMA